MENTTIMKRVGAVAFWLILIGVGSPSAEAKRVIVRGQLKLPIEAQPLAEARVDVVLKGWTVGSDPIVTPDVSNEYRTVLTDASGRFRAALEVPDALFADPTVTCVYADVQVVKHMGGGFLITGGGRALIKVTLTEEASGYRSNYECDLSRHRFYPWPVAVNLVEYDGRSASGIVVTGFVRDAQTRTPLGRVYLQAFRTSGASPSVVGSTESLPSGEYVLAIVDFPGPTGPLTVKADPVYRGLNPYFHREDNDGRINGLLYRQQSQVISTLGQLAILDFALERDDTKAIVFGRLLDGPTRQPVANAHVRLLESNDPQQLNKQVLTVGTDFLGRYQFAVSELAYVDLHSNGAYDCKNYPTDPYYCEHVWLNGRLHGGELFEQDIILQSPRAKQ